MDIHDVLWWGWKLRLFELSNRIANLGFTAVTNVGTLLASRKWSVLLNTDAFPCIEWLKKLLTRFKKTQFSFFIEVNSSKLSLKMGTTRLPIA